MPFSFDLEEIREKSQRALNNVKENINNAKENIPLNDTMRENLDRAKSRSSDFMVKAKAKLNRSSRSFNSDDGGDDEDDIEGMELVRSGSSVSTTSKASTTTEAAAERLGEFSEAFCPKLSWQQRVIGFGVTFGIGYMISFFSFKFFVQLIEGNPIPFALNYTFGNILAICSTTFLCGPARQFRKMLDEKRKHTSIVYLTCLFSTFVIVFVPIPKVPKLIILVLFIIVQFCASFWYTLSYIPFGRRTVSRFIKKQIVGLTEE